MQMLRTSKVMNRDQISIHEVIHESQMDLNDQSITFDEFDAAENGNTQNFLEMRELVAQGRSIIDIIRSDCFTPIVTGSFDSTVFRFVMVNDLFFRFRSQ